MSSRFKSLDVSLVLRPAFEFQHLVFSLLQSSNIYVFLLCNEIFHGSLTEEASLWTHWWARLKCPFHLRKAAPVFTGKNQQRQARLTRGSALTLREILSDGRLECSDRKLLRKLAFFFGDSIEEDYKDLYLNHFIL